MKKTYRLGDRLSLKESKALKVRRDLTFSLGDGRLNGRYARAVSTGFKRSPQKGEWYLSGAIPTAYKAPSNLSSEYIILKLVAVERLTIISEEIIETN